MRRPEAGTAAPFLFLTRTAPKKIRGLLRELCSRRGQDDMTGERMPPVRNGLCARNSARGREKAAATSPPWGGSRCAYRDTANGRQMERATHLARGARPYLRKQMPQIGAAEAFKPCSREKRKAGNSKGEENPCGLSSPFAPAPGGAPSPLPRGHFQTGYSASRKISRIAGLSSGT